jgi:hypothetical protein
MMINKWVFKQKNPLLGLVAFDVWVRIRIHSGSMLQVNCPILYTVLALTLPLLIKSNQNQIKKSFILFLSDDKKYMHGYSACFHIWG